jgi:thermitase
VAATDADGELAPFSDFGGWVDAAALGVDVTSCFVWLESGGHDRAPGTESRRYGTARWSGTSFAAPRVAAEIAVLRRDGHSAVEARELACVRHPFVR